MGNKITEQKQVANEIFFFNREEIERKNSFATKWRYGNPRTIFIKSTNYIEVYEIISNLKNKKG